MTRIFTAEEIARNAPAATARKSGAVHVCPLSEVPSLVADSVGFAALIVGQPVDMAKVGAIIDGITVMLDGQEVARGLKGDDGLDPLEMVGVLMQHARERGVTLRKGELVTTGTITKPFDIVGRKGAIVTRAPGVELVYQTSTG